MNLLLLRNLHLLWGICILKFVGLSVLFLLAKTSFLEGGCLMNHVKGFFDMLVAFSKGYLMRLLPCWESLSLLLDYGVLEKGGISNSVYPLIS